MLVILLQKHIAICSNLTVKFTYRGLGGGGGGGGGDHGSWGRLPILMDVGRNFTPPKRSYSKFDSFVTQTKIETSSQSSFQSSDRAKHACLVTSCAVLPGTGRLWIARSPSGGKGGGKHLGLTCGGLKHVG